MATQCTSDAFPLAGLGRRHVVGKFDGAGQFCGFGVWAGVLAALDPAAVGRAQGGGEADPAG